LEARVSKIKRSVEFSKYFLPTYKFNFSSRSVKKPNNLANPASKEEKIPQSKVSTRPN